MTLLSRMCAALCVLAISWTAWLQARSVPTNNVATSRSRPATQHPAQPTDLGTAPLTPVELSNEQGAQHVETSPASPPTAVGQAPQPLLSPADPVPMFVSQPDSAITPLADTDAQLPVAADIQAELERLIDTTVAEQHEQRRAEAQTRLERRLRDELSLSDEKAIVVADTIEQTRSQVRAAFTAGTASRETFRQAITDGDEVLRNVLDPDEYERTRAWIRSHFRRRGRRSQPDGSN